MTIKKTTISITLLISLFFIGLSPVFAADTTSSKNTPCKLATTPAECHSQPLGCQDSKGDIVDDTPRNCLFLEEPIGGKKKWDLYTVTCTEGEGKDKKKKCTTKLWGGGSLQTGERGPIQALLTEDKSKPYQGPFTLLYNYLNLVYTYMSGLIIGISVLFVVIGGIQMTTSAGDETKFTEGRSRITKAIAGIILWFTASLILYTINPTFFAF